jgi:hypothetical protein
MKTDLYTKFILTIIAAALVVIAFKLVNLSGPTRGDFFNLKNIEDSDARSAKRKDLMMRLPLIWIQGGEIEAEVSGTVSIQ